MSVETELELQRSLGRLEAKVDSLLTEFRDNNHRDQAAFTETEKRLNSLEKWRAGIVAVGSFISFVLGLGFIVFKGK